MGFISNFAQIDRKFAWSFLGFVLAAIFGGIAIYTEFIRDTSPVIKYEILTNTKVLDVKEDVNGLSVIYNNEDIRKTKKTLSVVTVKISNEGKTAILKTYYDPISPLGLSIGLGEIIKAEIIDAPTNYLQQNALKKQIGPTSIIFSDVIIEPSEYYVVKMLVINPDNATVAVYPSGKVANVKYPTLVNLTSGKIQESFWIRVIKGSVWVQLTRIPIYFVGFFILIGSVFGPMVFVFDRIDKRRRAKVITQFSVFSKNKYDELNEKLYDYYKENGTHTLTSLRTVVSNNEKLKELIESYEKYLSEEKDSKESDELIVNELPPHMRRIKRPVIMLRSLESLGLITKAENKYQRDEVRINAMNEFLDFVTIKEA